MIFIVLAFLLLAPVAMPAARYKLIRDSSGNDFFSGWDFYGNYDDSTFGDVYYATQSQAFSQNLAFVKNGNIILKVDNTTNVANGQKRNSVRISSKETYSLGSLWIIDLIHVPWGCGVWPIFWTLGRGQWPNAGEIDIIEAVNLRVNNQMSVHTLPGCTHTNNTNEIGLALQPDCSQESGCPVVETKQNNLQKQFAAAGGGVWATEFDTSGIKIWFWSRPDIPPSVRNATAQSDIDTSDWDFPSAVFANTTCNIKKHFAVQNLILEITLCGKWAGKPSVYQAECANFGPTGKCYNDVVVGPGSPQLDEAYFEISYVRTYSAVPNTSGARSVDQLLLWKSRLMLVFVIMFLHHTVANSLDWDMEFWYLTQGGCHV